MGNIHGILPEGKVVTGVEVRAGHSCESFTLLLSRSK